MPVWLLVLITAIGPTSLQIFVPALPAIQAHFAVSAATSQLVLSISVLAMALATLIYGPLADRYGRRPVLLSGQSLFVLGSALCTAAPTLPLLVLGRVLQAMGGAAGFILVRTMVSDLYPRQQTARVLATVTMSMVAGPMVAPAIGGFLTDLAGWRAIFLLMSAVGMLLLPLTAVRLPETRPADTVIAGIGSMVLGFGSLLRSPRFCGYAFSSALSVCVFYAFISSAPYVMVDVFDRTVTEYGFYFMIISVTFIGGNAITRRFAPQTSLDRLVVLGCVVALFATLVLFGLMWAHIWVPLAIFLPTALGGFANGMSMPAAQAGAVSVDPTRGGTASGLVGFLQLFLAAVVAQLMGLAQNGTPYPMAAAMVLCALLALTAIVVGWGLQTRPTARIPQHTP